MYTIVYNLQKTDPKAEIAYKINLSGLNQCTYNPIKRIVGSRSRNRLRLSPESLGPAL